MPNSLRSKLSKLRYKRRISDEGYRELIDKLRGHERYTHSEYWEQIYQFKPIADEIIAWRELPQPYRAESEVTTNADCD